MKVGNRKQWGADWITYICYAKYLSDFHRDGMKGQTNTIHGIYKLKSLCTKYKR